MKTIEAPYVARESRTEGTRDFGISKAGSAMEIMTLGAVHKVTAGTGEIRIVWENNDIRFEQPPGKIAEIIRSNDSKQALEEMLRLGVILVDPNKSGQRWPSSVLRSFQEGIKLGYLVLEGGSKKEEDK
ncbi:MAG: hypothetical protein LVQ95_02920 [Candidatus Micrarchaeales archaeon]|nr:hypothetical protein [Candidatus Micrarchaeales archaeon]